MFDKNYGVWALQFSSSSPKGSVSVWGLPAKDKKNITHIIVQVSHRQQRQ